MELINLVYKRGFDTSVNERMMKKREKAIL